MFLDDLLKLADAQESTVSVASTSHIDTLAKGDAYVPNFAYIRIDTAFTAGAGQPNASFKIQSSSSSTFASDVNTLCESETLLASSLIAGKEYKLRLASGAKRYIRGYMTVGVHGGTAISDTHKFGAGKFVIFLVTDVDIDRNLA